MGEEEIPLTIHTAVLKGLSDPFDAMINNGIMKESTSGVAVLKDIDVEIFPAFCEYAYSSDFACTRANHINREFEVTTEATEDESQALSMETQTKADKLDEPEDTDDNDCDRGTDEYRGNWNQKSPFYSNDFKDRIFRQTSRWNIPIHFPGYPPLKGEDFIFCIRLYVFSTRYIVEPLRNFCLQHMRDRLCEADLTEDSHKILDLLEYTYLHTSSQEPWGEYLMRDLLMHYVAWKFNILSRNEDFGRILRSNAEIGADLFLAMAKWRREKKCKCICYC